MNAIFEVPFLSTIFSAFISSKPSQNYRDLLSVKLFYYSKTLNHKINFKHFVSDNIQESKEHLENTICVASIFKKNSLKSRFIIVGCVIYKFKGSICNVF